MEITAEAKYIRMSPRKVRLVTEMVKGMKAKQALATLKFVSKAAARPVAKVIASAVANAVKNKNQDEDKLVIQYIEAKEGPRYKRRDKSKGARHFGILQKRTSHIRVVLEEVKNQK